MPGRPPAFVRPAAAGAVALLLSCLAAFVFPLTSGARSARAGVLPPSNPQYALAVGRYLPPSCSGLADHSASCVNESLGMINAGRRSEGLGPLVLPANWQQLTVARQLFVLTDLERTARGLLPEAYLSPTWSAVAETGAQAGKDPADTLAGATYFGSLWAGGEPNTIVVMADWVYEDGLFADGSSENLFCTSSSRSACWAHRDLVLQDGSSQGCDSRCVVGAGYSPVGYRGAAAGDGHDSYAEVLGRAPGFQPYSFSWAAERDQLPACERAGDTCGWAGNPLLTPSGLRRAGTSHAVSPGRRPSFSVNVKGLISAAGRVRLTIHVGARLARVRVAARLRTRRVALRVRRSSLYVFTATGRLAPGSWNVTIRYRRTLHSVTGPSSHMTVTVSG